MQLFEIDGSLTRTDHAVRRGRRHCLTYNERVLREQNKVFMRFLVLLAVVTFVSFVGLLNASVSFETTF